MESYVPARNSRIQKIAGGCFDRTRAPLLSGIRGEMDGGPKWGNHLDDVRVSPV